MDDGWMDAWVGRGWVVCGQKDVWMDGRWLVWVVGCMCVWMGDDGRMIDGWVLLGVVWTGGWTDGQRVGRMGEQLSG